MIKSPEPPEKLALLIINAKKHAFETISRPAHGKLLIITAALLLIVTAGIYAFGVNQPLFLWMQGWGGRLPSSFWASVTLLGDSFTLSVMLLLFARKHPKILWAGVLAALVTTIVVQSLKHSLVLPRPPLIIPPEELLLIGPEYQHAAFPSGHAAAVWVLISVWLFNAYHWSKAVLLLSLATLVSVSRVMVGAHWPVDITAGAFFGWLGGWCGVWLSSRWRWGVTLTGQRIMVAALLPAALALIGYDSGYTQAGVFVNIIAITCLAAGGHYLYVLMRHPGRLRHLSTDEPK